MANGNGYVEQRCGRWRARLPRRLCDGKQHSATFDTEAEAYGWLNAQIEAAAGLADSKGTLSWWGGVWMERRKARGLSSYSDDEGRWRQHVAESSLADLRVGAIKPQHVAEFSRWLSTRRALRQVIGGGRERTGPILSRQTQQHVLKLLDLALSDAVLEGLLPANPCAEVRVVPSAAGEDVDAWTWLRQPEIDRLSRCDALPAQARACYVVAIYTGLREGELWALDWGRVVLDGERPHLLVAKSNRRRSTKSGKVRTVPLLAPARAALIELHLAQGRPRAGLVFPGADGRQRPEGDDHGWADRSRGKQGVQRGHRSAAGIDRPVRFHDLRHTCASHLLQGTWGRRWRLEEVRDFLGHSSITVTQRYAHLCADSLHEAAAATRAPSTAPKSVSVGVDLSSVGSVGFEPTTNGLKGRGIPQDFRAVGAAGVRSGGARELAQAVIQLARVGQPVPELLLVGLARQVLDQPAVRLAQGVLAGGEFALSRALDLAVLVLGGEGEQLHRRKVL